MMFGSLISCNPKGRTETHPPTFGNSNFKDWGTQAVTHSWAPLPPVWLNTNDPRCGSTVPWVHGVHLPLGQSRSCGSRWHLQPRLLRKMGMWPCQIHMSYLYNIYICVCVCIYIYIMWCNECILMNMHAHMCVYMYAYVNNKGAIFSWWCTVLPHTRVLIVLGPTSRRHCDKTQICLDFSGLAVLLLKLLHLLPAKYDIYIIWLILILRANPPVRPHNC
jgi:hypothetical protein